MQKLWWSFLLLFLASSVQAATLKFVTQEAAPFHYAQDGVAAGPVTELVSKVCAEMHVECSFKVLPWRRAQNDVRQGKADGMFVLGWNESRAPWVHFSPPFMRTEYGFFVRQDNPLQFKSVEDVKGYRVAVFGPSNTSNSLEKIKAQVHDLTIDMSPKDESAFQKLSLGRADAVYSNHDLGNYLIKKLELTNIRYAGRQRALVYHVGFSKQYVEKSLVDRFNAALVALFRRGEAQAILRQGGLTPTDLK